MKIPDRVRWALSVVDPGPADHVLEIGCGPGVAVQRTAARNSSHVDAGRLEVRQSTLDGLDVPPASLDKAFCVNVNLFWAKDPTPNPPCPPFKHGVSTFQAP